MSRLGIKITRLLQELGSQTRLASASGINRENLKRMIRDDKYHPSHWFNLVSCSDITLEDLLKHPNHKEYRQWVLSLFALITVDRKPS